MKKSLYSFFLFFSLLSATIINIPTDYSTIQDGINASVDGDTVLVADGTYYENLSIAKDITLASHFIIDGDYSHRDATIIDGSAYDEDSGPFGSCVLFLPPENGDHIHPRLTGFTIQNGKGTRFRGIIDNEITYFMGGGLMIWYSLPEITYNYIRENGSGPDTRAGSTKRGGGSLLNFDDAEVEFDEDRNGSYSRTVHSRDDEIIFSNNIFENNYSETGNTFQSIGYEGDIDFSDSYFDVFASANEDVSEYWVRSGDANTDFTGGSGQVEAIYEDVFVSPNGTNEISIAGTELDPFKTINYAMGRIYQTDDNSITINLTEGTFSPASNGEIFPINMASNINLIGVGEDVTILDAEQTYIVMDMEGTYMDYCTNNTISDLTITGGEAWFYPDWLGGGMRLSYSDPTITNVTITNNMALGGGGMLIQNYSNPTLTGVTITNNTAAGSHGGGVYSGSGSNPTFTDVNITNNAAYQFGGGMYINWGSSPTLTGVTITNNTASGGGGMLINNACNPTLTGVTITNNTGYSSRGGGVYVETGSNPTFTNSILWNNIPHVHPSLMANIGGVPSVTYSDIEGGWDGEGNIDLDPLFTDPENGDFTLQEGSPCIDAGLADLDGDGVEDIPDYYGSAPDMGAFEYGALVIVDETKVVPEFFTLHQNYPNPFNPTTILRYNLPELTQVTLTVYDMLGKKVTQLVNATQEVGYKSIRWNATNNRNESVSAGLYLYTIQAGEFRQTKKMVLLK